MALIIAERIFFFFLNVQLFQALNNTHIFNYLN